MTADPVRWGFLGAGMISRVALAPAVKASSNAVLHAVAARDLDRARGLGPAVAYGSYDALLADPDVEAVYVALANDAHLPWVLAALEAGKPVLCEKPLGLTLAEVEQMGRASARTSLPVVEASWYRWHPRVRRAQEALGGGAVGSVRHVSAGFTFAGVADDNYRLDPAMGGGALYDVGCYAVSAALWGVGQGVPQTVSARVTEGPTGVDLTTEAILEWADGAQAQVRGSIAEPEKQWLTITGERGEVELPGQPFTAWLGEPPELWVSDGAGTERTPTEASDPYRLMVEAFSGRLRGDQEAWLLPLAESAACAAVLDAVREAGRTGSPQAVAVPDVAGWPA